ncbi:hypothetical protein H257_16571 [Aphanomyces astaci]|uniref:Uncharacterized protein n=1 Tax=Aphanomyces astaci TaxID=112090 RepID=W4FI73_APHAT|nr:hypothetical protein H257_16571 [Aphanomyces astaci]ETV67175.1 hypothetical protein H257_16571 [Aphanomyces astaci]|eukprot:XP_009843340.1 hypothetical protein H257_16571 [Aphanomyces astaci]
MSSSSLTTADIHATSAAATTQPCLHGDPIRGGVPEAVLASTSIASEQVPWRAIATATAVKTLLEILRPFSDYVQPFVAIFVLAMSTQVILGVYVLGAACMVVLDHRFRGFIAAETSSASLLCITLMCAKTSVDVATSNGDATPLHTLFKPFADPTTLADMVWTVLIKCLVLRLVMHSVVTFAGLVLEWQRASTLDQLTTRLAFYFTPRLPIARTGASAVRRAAAAAPFASWFSFGATRRSTAVQPFTAA